MKTKLAAAFLLSALVLLATRVVLQISENGQRDAIREKAESELEIEAQEKSERYYHAQMRELWRIDEARRIEWATNVETFNADGTWKYADPDHDAHFREQMRQLGWSDQPEDCMATKSTK